MSIGSGAYRKEYKCSITLLTSEGVALMVPEVFRKEVMWVGLCGPMQSLARSLPALLPYLYNVASICACLGSSRVSAQELKARLAVCHTALFAG